MKTRRLPSSPLIIVSSDSINPDLNGGNLVVSCCKCQVHFLTGAINEACFGNQSYGSTVCRIVTNFCCSWWSISTDTKKNRIFILFQLQNMEHVMRINYMAGNKIISLFFSLILFFYCRLTIEKGILLMTLNFSFRIQL
jgi:hypothetical protein